MELKRICGNCSYFMCDGKDYKSGYGVCLYDMGDFEPYCDEIYENSDFSSCMDLYDEKRFDGDSDVCDNYSEVELIEIDDNVINGDEVDLDYIRAAIEGHEMQNREVDDLEKMLASDISQEKKIALKAIMDLSLVGNKKACEALFNYFLESPPAHTLEEVHLRLKIIDLLQQKMGKKDLADPFIDELLKTPSNNTTRRIYTEIFRFFERCDPEIGEEPLYRYLEESECSYRLKKRVSKIIEDYDKYSFFF